VEINREKQRGAWRSCQRLGETACGGETIPDGWSSIYKRATEIGMNEKETDRFCLSRESVAYVVMNELS